MAPPAPTTSPRRRRRRRRLPIWATPVIIVVVLVAAEVAAGVVGPNVPRTSGSEERAFIKADQLYRRSGSTDVVILGSSETAGGLVPSEMAKAAPDIDGIYNAALAGTFLPTYRDWADQVVIPAVDPKVVVIGMLPMAVGDIGAKRSASYTKPRAAYLSAFDQITGGKLGSAGWKLRQRSALIRYRPYLRQPNLLAKGVKATVTGDDSPSAQQGTELDWKKETDPDRVKANTGPDGEVYDYRSQSLPTEADPIGAAIYQQFAQGSLDLTDLEAFVADLEARDIQPVIVMLPVDRGPLTRGGADLDRLDEWTRATRKWADANDVPMRDEFTKDWASDLFHDRNHLDEAGATKLSEIVGRWLQELCTNGDLHADCAR